MDIRLILSVVSTIMVCLRSMCLTLLSGENYEHQTHCIGSFACSHSNNYGHKRCNDSLARCESRVIFIIFSKNLTRKTTMRTNKSVEAFIILDRIMKEMKICVQAYTKIEGRFKEEDVYVKVNEGTLLDLMIEASDAASIQEAIDILKLPFWPESFRYLEPGQVLLAWEGAMNLREQLSRNRYNEEQKLELLRLLARKLQDIHTTFWDISMGVM